MRDDRYQRYSDPERYRALVDAAQDELERLEREFDVVRSDGADVDPSLVSVSGRGRLIRLTPRLGDGAPVTMWLDDDPDSDVLRYGLVVRFGRCYRQLMPSCGCDYCFEEAFETADELIEDLKFEVGAVVAGGYVERLEDSGSLYVRFSLSTDRWQATEQFEAEPAPDIDQPASGWGPWVRRA